MANTKAVSRDTVSEHQTIPEPFLTDLPKNLMEPAEHAKEEGEKIERASESYAKTAWRRFRRDPLAMIGLIVLTVIALFALIAPEVSQYAYDSTDFMMILSPPSREHWFGTDLFGRDVFIRTMYGARISLIIGFACAAINMVIGVFYGGISGYFGGKVDMVMMRIVDILSAIPSLLYLILIMMYIGASVRSILLAMCLTYWISTARMVRGEIFRLREQDYVMAAQVCGKSRMYILTHHLLPNSMGSIIVTVSFLIPSAIFEEAFLSFLGIGIQVPMASLGSMCNDAIPYLMTQPYLMAFPAITICITIFALNFIGDGLRDALDPRLNKY